MKRVTGIEAELSTWEPTRDGESVVADKMIVRVSDTE
jgi:hypothetical protein